ATDGRVKDIYDNSQTGKTIVFDIGNGYELTYGQLEDVNLAKGDFVKAGDIVGKVAAPTIYYSEEGSNVYFKLTKDGMPINPMDRLK
ncbi:MAG: M23 family metallopeptidase, partial [Lachnospiraceae bacterium]|nr:M23 family metallopeptidase [Lachnospiraceae bacterium]